MNNLINKGIILHIDSDKQMFLLGGYETSGDRIDLWVHYEGTLILPVESKIRTRLWTEGCKYGENRTIAKWVEPTEW
jgi:hypothetical protein